MRIACFILFICVLAASCRQGIKEEQKKRIALNAEHDSLLHGFVLRTVAIPDARVTNELDSILTRSAKDSLIFCSTINYLENPFGDPNSAYRNEDLNIQLLKAKINSPWYNTVDKTKARDKLFVAMQNHISSPANDFTYTTAAGSKMKMYELHSGFTLLYFYNPECEACKEMKASLTASSVITNKIKTGELKLLAMYTDRDEKLWLDHLKEMPQTWIQGRDENEYLYKNKIYDLKAIPTVYLLDKNKKVLLKDCMDITRIEKKLGLIEIGK